MERIKEILSKVLKPNLVEGRKDPIETEGGILPFSHLPTCTQRAELTFELHDVFGRREEFGLGAYKTVRCPECKKVESTFL